MGDLSKLNSRGNTIACPWYTIAPVSKTPLIDWIMVTPALQKTSRVGARRTDRTEVAPERMQVQVALAMYSPTRNSGFGTWRALRVARRYSRCNAEGYWRRERTQLLGTQKHRLGRVATAPKNNHLINISVVGVGRRHLQSQKRPQIP
jgi:hypothetical protein